MLTWLQTQKLFLNHGGYNGSQMHVKKAMNKALNLDVLMNLEQRSDP